MDLGGNIKLEGFDKIEPGKLVVVKKIIGNLAKELSEKKKYDLLTVKLKEKGNKNNIEVILKQGDHEEKKEVNSSNLFIGLNEVLDNLNK